MPRGPEQQGGGDEAGLASAAVIRARLLTFLDMKKAMSSWTTPSSSSEMPSASANGLACPEDTTTEPKNR